MAKMTRDMKEERKDMKSDFESIGGVILVNPAAGVVVCAAPAVNFDDARFVRVAVAQCDFKDDTFKRKYGEWLALSRWYDEQTLSIPTHGYKDADEIAGEFIGLFE